MTNGEKIKVILKPRTDQIRIYGDWVEIEIQSLGINFSCELSWWNSEYKEPTTKNDLGVDCISRAEVTELLRQYYHSKSFTDEQKKVIYELSKDLQYLIHSVEVTPQEPKTGHCKDCKWWKDSDGVYRRGVRAESQCPINRREVFEGNGYCFLFEPQESEYNK